MSKEIYISTTPHETRLAIVEEEQLTEIYYERENEYTLAGSIYNGKVTRVLPGMQSSFVDIGLERDAFLYVTDFMEEQGDAADFEAEGNGHRRPAQARESEGGRSGDRSADRGRTGRRGDRRDGQRQADTTAETESTVSFDEPVAPAPVEGIAALDAAAEGGGSRRWRGRRGRRRGRSTRDEQSQTSPLQEDADATESDSVVVEGGYVEALDAEAHADEGIEIDLGADPVASAGTSYERPRFGEDRGGGRRGGRDSRDRRGRDRGPRRDSERGAPRYDNSYAGYYSEEALPEPTGEPILLPGESIRKYRDPAEVAAEEAEAARTAPPKVETVTIAAPSYEVAGWDGKSDVLPGESIARRRRTGAPASAASATKAKAGTDTEDTEAAQIPQESFAQPEAVAPVEVAEPVVASASSDTDAPTPIASTEAVAAPEAFDESAGLTEHPAHGVSAAAVEAAATADLGALPGDTPAGASAEPVTDGAEYEPAEGASASVTDDSRRNLRRREHPEASAAQVAAQTSAEASEATAEPVAETPDATTYDLNTSGDAAPTTDSDTTHEETGQPAAAEALDTVIVETAVEHDHPEPAEPNFTTLQASGELLSVAVEHSVEEAGFLPLTGQDTANPTSPITMEEAVQSVPLSEAESTPKPMDISDTDEEIEQDGGEDADAETLPEIHAYGDGDFHEEEMDEELDGDDFEYHAAIASLDDGEIEEYEEETLDESADLGSMLHDISEDRQSEVVAAPHGDEATYVIDTGGFSVDDFNGEPDDEDEEASSDEGNTTEQTPRREGQRRFNGRDRRGGRNSGGDRGRGRRPSVQTQDLPAINELLKPGQEILVQIAKEPIAKKGARITSHIALPGRFLVFMPTVNHTGVSRKISSDEERRRLKSILLSEKGDATGGFIVRTAAEGASEEELRNDLRFLIHLWTDIKARSESSKSPALIYHDLNLVERILRDQVTDNFSAIWVDTEIEYERVLRFLQRFQPSLVRRVKLYTKETPLFEHFSVTQEIDKALKSKVWLKSGGSIVINQTEALVAIDINTGKYVGKTARLEDTILKTNLDAIPEIVRQIRLRDLGGIIVIDFIDMDERKNRAKVLQTLEDAMRADRAPSKILPFNDFGLVIMTRKRVKQSLERTLCIPDPVTEGTGMIKSPVTIANEIYVEMRKMYRHLEKTDVMLRVHPEVVKTLKASGGKRLQELEDMTRKTILVKSDPSLSPEAFDIH